MRAFAFINQKGGVGKTTSAVTVAAAYARNGDNVLLIDNDPQGHVGKSLGIPAERMAGGVVSLYEDEAVTLEEAAQPAFFEDHPHVGSFGPERDNLSLILSSLDLVNFERQVYFDEEGGASRLAQRAPEAMTLGLDVLIVDCPPNLGAFTFNAMAFVRALQDAGAEGGLVVPTGMSRLDVDGLVELMGVLDRLRGEAVAPGIAAIIPTMTNPQTIMAKEVLSSFREAYAPRVTSHVRTTVRLKEATYRGLTIFEHDPDGIGAEDYRQVVRDLDRMGKP